MPQLLAIAATPGEWPRAYRCANLLLDVGANVLWAERPFAGRLPSGERRTFGYGDFLVTALPADGGPDWPALVAEQVGLDPVRLDGVEDFSGLRLKPLRIAMYGGGGAPFNHARIFAELGFHVDWILPEEVRRGRLAEFDVFGMPGGGWMAMKGQLDPLGAEGCRAVRDFVREGGLYFGSCAGSFDAAIVSESFVAVCPQQREMQLVNALVWNRDDTEWVGLQSPGIGVLESRTVRPDHPVMFGMPERFRITHYNGPFFEPAANTLDGASDMAGLAAVEGFTDDFTPSEDFMRFSRLDPAAARADPESKMVTRAARAGSYNVVTGHNGLGRVVLFGSHPEFGYNLAMDRWEVPARMLANAAFWQSAYAPARPRLAKSLPGAAVGYPAGASLRAVAACLQPITAAAQALRSATEGAQPSWLSEDLAMSSFGLSGDEIWRRNLAAFGEVAAEIENALDRLETLTQQGAALAAALQDARRPATAGLAAELDAACLGLEEAIHYQRPAEWHQDFGYEGVLQMLGRTGAMLATARENLGLTFEPAANPYEHGSTSPYQLVVGSYLAALGVFANAWFLLRMHELRLTSVAFLARARAAAGEAGGPD